MNVHQLAKQNGYSVLKKCLTINYCNKMESIRDTSVGFLYASV